MNTIGRVAFLSEHANPLSLLGGEDSGGQNVYVDEISSNLPNLGFEVDVFVRREDAAAPIVVNHRPGVRVIHLDAGPPRVLPKDKLWPFMPDFRDAFLHFSSQHPRSYNLIHSNFWMSGWVACELRRRLPIPVVQIFHALGATKRREQGEADTSPDDRIAIEGAVCRNVNALIAQCPSEVDELRREYAADPRRVTVIPSGVNADRFRPVDVREARKCIRLDQDRFVVVYVGRLLPRKDIRNVVRAVAELARAGVDDICLLIVGGDAREPDPVITPEIGALQSLASELGIADRVRITGKRQPDELRVFYSAADVTVTTPWYEPYGLTPLEAMACGRPVVGSNVGGIPFTVADGESGFVVPPRDPAALAERIDFLRRHPEMRRAMGAQARRRIEQRFTWPTTAARTAELYRELQSASDAQRLVAANRN